jgi:hypothetical protein
MKIKTRINSFVRWFIRIFKMPTATATPVYWPETQSLINECDLSYVNDKWSEDMIRDGMRAILITGDLPQVKSKEINVWKYLSEYSPPPHRGFQFSAGDDAIVTLVQDNMKIGHSGCSMGWTMRQIEFIAKNGLSAHRAMFLSRIRPVRREQCDCGDV